MGKYCNTWRRSTNYGVLVLSQVLDCQYSCFWSAPAVIPIELLQLPMPSHESTWDAPSREEWQESLSKCTSPGYLGGDR
jgi:hypothetical protein